MSDSTTSSNTNDSVINEINQATTHYQVLGILLDDTTDVDAAALRKAYLRRSVKVHPDKNNSPGAKEAFQKVAAAWQVLSDDNSRAAYDAALRQGRANINDNANYDGTSSQQQQTYYAGPPPSMQESLFVFATVVGSMMGGKTVANLSEALFWAEKLMRQSENKSRSAAGGQGGSEDETLSNGEKATLAMALGSSLKVASSAARSLGMQSASQKLDQGARMAQVAGVGMMVADTPMVKNLLSSPAAMKLKGGIHAVRAALNQQQQQQQQQQQASSQASSSPHDGRKQTY